jgi:predicted amidohydrolase YtcJ
MRDTLNFDEICSLATLRNWDPSRLVAPFVRVDLLDYRSGQGFNLQNSEERAKRLGVRVDAQSSFLWEKAATVAKYLGKSVANRAFPMRTMIDIMGLDAVAQGTDYPFNPLNPFVNMYIMVTRKDVTGEIYGASEAISREEAIRLYTSSASRYSFSEGRTGSIEPGKLADMIVLSHDIMEVPDEKLK